MMKSWSALLIAIWLSAASAPLSSHSATKQNNDVFAPAGDVTFTIRLDQTTYEVGKPITFRYRITNTSQTAIFVPRGEWDSDCVYPPHILPALLDASGHDYVPGYAGSCLSRGESTAQRMRESSVVLSPGKSRGGTYSLDSSIFGSELKPGKYRMTVKFVGWHWGIFKGGDMTSL
ncbi:MAG TPA: hypothetical protein VGC88_01925, partial [Terriglobales bacterium]